MLRGQRNPRFCAPLGDVEDFHKSTLTRLAIANYREVSSHLALRFREILLFPLLASERDEKRRLFEILRDTEKVLLGLRGV